MQREDPPGFFLLSGLVMGGSEKTPSSISILGAEEEEEK